MLVHFLTTFAFSVIIIFLILLTKKYHGHLSHDNLGGIQKYHKTSTPRIGGLAIYLSFALAVIGSRIFKEHDLYDVGIVLCSAIVFFVGILEDVTKKISPKIRMIGFVLGTFVAIHITESMPVIFSTDFIGLDHLIYEYEAIGILFSLFAVVGLTNAYNVIDGYNGLSATTAIINFIGMFILAFFLSDTAVMWTSMYLIAALLGFLVFNYPRGKIFLGDGGAYLIGFVMAVLSIYLVETHRGAISAYAVLLLNIYPVTEIGFSIYRRKLIHYTHMMDCDNFHLHQLIYHRCVPFKSQNRNAQVMPLMLYFIVPQMVLTLLFYKSTAMCLLFVAVYMTFYTFSYFCLLKFKTLYFLKIMLKRNQRLHKN